MRYEWNLRQPTFTVENIDILQVSREKNYKHSYRNGRLKHGFVYTVKGEMQDTFFGEQNRQLTVRAGELIFIPKGCSYVGTYLSDDTEIRIVQFDVANGELPPYLSQPTKLDLPDASSLIDAFFAEPIQGEGDSFYHFACLYRLLWKIEQQRKVFPKEYGKLKNALVELSAHPEEQHSIAYYAELAHMSEVNFRRLFRQYKGVSPIDYRNGLRLSSARTKIQSGEYNVSEAAAAVGFSNLSFFIRLYRKKFGCTPTER